MLGKVVAVMVALACFTFGLWLEFESFIPDLPSSEYWGDTILAGAFGTIGTMILGILLVAPAIRAASSPPQDEPTPRAKDPTTKTGRHPEG